MSNNTFTKAQIQTLIAAGIDLNEFFGGAEAPAPQPKADGRNHAARKHNYDRRIHRFEATERGGLTKAQRRGLAAELRADLGREFTAEEWDVAVGHFKKALRKADAR